LAPASAFEAHLHAPREEHDRLVTGCIRALANELDGEPALHALFFGRYNKPDWHVRLRVLGNGGRFHDRVEAFAVSRFDRLVEEGRLAGWSRHPYEREVTRYGGEEGADLAERVFHLDTRACVAVLRAEAEGLTRRSRREWCLLVTERYLDALGLRREERVEFYRYGWSFETRLGRWQADDLAALDRRYRDLSDDLRALIRSRSTGNPEETWGGPVPARIAADYFGALDAVLGALRDGQRDGRIRAHPIDLAWGLAHMHCNRMQVEADAEAIIRYFMGRLHEDADLGAGA